MVYADSVTPFSDEVYRYSENAEMVAAFRKSLATIAALPCDILLTPHPSASQLLERLDPTSGIGLVDTHACRAYAATGSEKLDTRLSKERADRPGNVPSQKQPTPGP
ncbi:MAG: hypothetical protein JF591_18835 [Lysobacter sp.]|nr:hypothetical protein [Lysobacter sp.]